ncbi:MAG: hypothetical protein H0U40_01795, partial [Chloroflexia bacterium]|nr:hypothetical protein [Chloroflexia bacterium]
MAAPAPATDTPVSRPAPDGADPASAVTTPVPGTSPADPGHPTGPLTPEEIADRLV